MGEEIRVVNVVLQGSEVSVQAGGSTDIFWKLDKWELDLELR